MNEPYVVHKTAYEDTYRDDFPSEPNTALFRPAMEMLSKNVSNGELVVPPGKYFVLGDNRDQSLDSRYWGFIGESDILGKPILIYDSIEQPSSAIMRPSLFPGSRRWGRLFKML